MNDHQAHPLREVFRAYLTLRLTAFGGPIAHLAHFRRELIVKRQWLDENAYVELVAFCQFMPGPTSSQVGFLLGWHRAGLMGAIVAWCAFTLPSAVALTAAAMAFSTIDASGHWLSGLRVAVLAIVAQAVLAMVRSLCPDAPRASIATGVCIVCILFTTPWVSVAALIPAALAGFLIPRDGGPGDGTSARMMPSWRISLACLILLALIIALALGSVFVGFGSFAVLASACVQAGSLVFGGGHVVLPLLHDPLVQGGLISDDALLAGYGITQALPGPLFTVAAWIGAHIGGIPGATLALVCIFAPGLLLALGCLRFYHGALAAPWARRVVRGLNAGVVGLLGAAVWSPIGTEAIHGPASVALALGAFVALESWKAPSWAVVIGCSVASMCAQLLG
jgi:chromate transporter